MDSSCERVRYVAFAVFLQKMKLSLIMPLILVLLLSGSIAIFSLFAYGGGEKKDVDSAVYIQMAEGRMEEVVRPYSNRVLHPLLARQLINAGLSTSSAFTWIAYFSLIAFVWTTAALFIESLGTIPEAQRLLLTGICLFSPIPLLYFQNIYLPDLFVAALTGCFFLSLSRKHEWWTVGILFYCNCPVNRRLSLQACLSFSRLHVDNGRLALWQYLL